MTFEKDEVLCGVKIGEHSFDNDKMIKEIKERVIARGVQARVHPSPRIC